MKVASSLLCRSALIGAACLLTQCAMPPRDAWRIVQSDGLIPYMMGSYESQPGPAQSRYLANSAPLMSTTSRATVDALPRVSQHQDSVPNRYLAGSYYEPESTPRSRPKSESSPSRKERSQKIVIEDEETPPPTLASNPEPKSSNKPAPAKDKPEAPPVKLESEELPYGTPVAGRPGMVNSPFATKDQLVDVTGMGVGETVKCPYSGKLFRVPPSQQAAAPKSTPSAPEPLEEPKPSPSPEPEAPAPTTPEADKPKS